MPWQGQNDTMIDRFDGRAHLDIIAGNGGFSGNLTDMEVATGMSKKDAKQHNYERFRILVQNDFLNSKFLFKSFQPKSFQVKWSGRWHFSLYEKVLADC